MKGLAVLTADPFLFFHISLCMSGARIREEAFLAGQNGGPGINYSALRIMRFISNEAPPSGICTSHFHPLTDWKGTMEGRAV
jgi:hypothetical protein